MIKKFESFGQSTSKIQSLYDHLIDFYYDGIGVKISDDDQHIKELFKDENFISIGIMFQTNGNESLETYSRKNKEFLDLLLSSEVDGRKNNGDGKWSRSLVNSYLIQEIESKFNLKFDERLFIILFGGDAIRKIYLNFIEV